MRSSNVIREKSSQHEMAMWCIKGVLAGYGSGLFKKHLPIRVGAFYACYKGWEDCCKIDI